MPNILKKELKHVLHVRGTKYNPDTHIVRDTVFYDDGTTENVVRPYADYKRPVYITLPHKRSYTQHKEREHKSNLARYMTTETNLSKVVADALGVRGNYVWIKELCNSPYVFGAASSSVTLIRREYKDKYGQPTTPLSYLAYDLETCVYDADGSIIISSLAMDDKVVVLIREDWVAGIPDPIGKIKALEPVLFEKYNYTEYMQGCDTEYRLVPTEEGVIKETARLMHLFNPDVVAAWNHDFDVNKLIKRCEALNISIADIFSHPAVPPHSRRFEFIEGKRSKITSAGDFRPLMPSEQWHNVRATTGFVWLDAMCTYRRLRTQNAFLPSYSLDAVCNLHLGVGKLQTDETEHMDSLTRHQYMQRYDKLTYCIYAPLDVRLMVLLEKQTKDITLRLPLELAGSDYFDTALSSQRTVDMFAEACEKDDYVLGTVGTTPDEFPYPVVSLSGWPLTLPNNLQCAEGIKCLADAPNLSSNIYPMAQTSDLTSAYPTEIAAFGVSKESTRHEYISMQGTPASPQQVLMQNMNIFNGSTNAMSYAVNVYGWPSLTEIDELIKNY